MARRRRTWRNGSHAATERSFFVNPPNRPGSGATDLLASIIQSSHDAIVAVSLDGTITRGATTARDVSARERVEVWLGAVFDAAPDAIIAVDADGRVVPANGRAGRPFDGGRERGGDAC